MELKDIIAPNYRKIGLSCHNCTHLVREYDLDADMSGVWICEKLPAYASYTAFPFAHQMPCFELSFWFSIFAGNFGESTDAYENALTRFSEIVARTKPLPLTPETLPSLSSDHILQQAG
jgi:hypothetical protein